MNFSKNVSGFWGKKRRDKNGQQLWLPLIVHLIDTSNTMNWLYKNWLSGGQKQILKAKTLSQDAFSDEDIQKLIVFLGFMHDIGKATPAFQTKPSRICDVEMDRNFINRLRDHGFSDLKLPNPNLVEKSPHATAGEALIEFGEDFNVNESVGAIIGAHHGVPLGKAPSRNIKDFRSNYYQVDKSGPIQDVWKCAQKELFDYGLHLAGYQSGSEIPWVGQPQAVILTGLLTMADWLASSEYFTNKQSDKVELFPLIPFDQIASDVDTSVRFEKAIRAWNLNGRWVPHAIEMNSDPYQKLWGFRARPVQKAVIEAVNHTKEPGMVIIEASTGSGKTEAALVVAEQLARFDHEDGIFFGLPTQATTNSMFDRVDDWLSKIAKSQKKNLSIRLMHSKAQFNRHFQRIPHANNIDDADDKYADGAVTINDWFSGKKSILTKFTVGTIDNLLQMSLKQKHLFLKHLGLSGKVVIIDEVHAIDVFMNQYLEQTIMWLGAYHVPIIVLSATLPKDKRSRLIKSYLTGKYGSLSPKKFIKPEIAPKDWETTESYPLVSILDGKKLTQITKFPGRNDQSPFQIQVNRINPSDDELINRVVSQLKGGGVAGIIVNTVIRAQKLTKLVPKEIKLMLLHGSFLETTRERLTQQLQDDIGKDGHRPNRMIIIGTQVLEQSLDIDFDVLYTDIAPIDLLLQRAGRLHRHQIQRPKNLQVPQLFITGIAGAGKYGKGNEMIYSKYLLMKTDYFLPDTISIPAMVSKLVQAVYSSETDGEVAEKIPGLLKAKDAQGKFIDHEECKAKSFRIKRPQQFGYSTIHSWLEHRNFDVDRDPYISNATVRDIKPTLEVILLQHTDDGDFLIDEGTTRGEKVTIDDAKLIAQQLIKLPVAVTERNMNGVLEVLQDLTKKYYPDWAENSWLKKSLALPLDEHFQISLSGWKLTYSTKFGLSYAKED
ncbi:CRISPR-associated helicase Cas3' [Lentilactobacillus raoultii]|uniref:CRISPR-associated helicase Cas3 n=1 Tax=Lentilactobacillus raoultii TaxID=1987503 RepID=A0ABW3PGS6_9LACO|nr:CRISPR-associated helicase Cas3' [Lentilactobacillus raoultii]